MITLWRLLGVLLLGVLASPGHAARFKLATVAPEGSQWIAELRATSEAKEGFAAFLQKRKPEWVK